MAELTKVFLNDWANYNEGRIGYGWLTPSECIDFMEDHEDEDREWFIADIDNYLGVDFGNLEYCNVTDICEQIKTLEDMADWERDEVIAVMEYRNGNVEDAIDNKDRYIIYPDEETYRASLDEIVEMSMPKEDTLISRYFDYESYYRDCDYDVYFCKNGAIIVE